jgi:peptidoglycan hydrolase-like protein with peptidoglycan-binding domain
MHLQGLLQQRGLYGGTVDGDFGWRTTEAVKAFQEQAGLHVDGVVGDKTWHALMS